VSTALPKDKGSMRAYVETVRDALSRHAPGIETEVVEIAVADTPSVLVRGLGVAAQHWRARRARRLAPDLWHVLDGSQAHVSRALGSTPVVITVHDVIPQLQDRGHFPGVPPLGRAARLFWQANGRALRLAPALACVSTSSAVDVQREFGVSQSSCHLVPLTLRPSIRALLASSEAPARSPGLVVHVGNNGFYKNRRGVLEIFALLHEDVGRRLLMAGPAPDSTLVNLVESLRIGNRVEWLVDPDDATLARIYREASLMLFPSHYEGFGWPVLEAMAFGLPLVCSNAGSLPEVVGDAAIMHPPSDHAAFAASATRLLGDTGFAATGSAKGLFRADAFSMERFASRLLETYAAALQTSEKSAA
jgi:glycosyltransferase involved in cell wall biosynthesis